MSNLFREHREQISLFTWLSAHILYCFYVFYIWSGAEGMCTNVCVRACMCVCVSECLSFYLACEIPERVGRASFSVSMQEVLRDRRL